MWRVGGLTARRLGPEHKFPTGINDCWDALKWVNEPLDPVKSHPRLADQPRLLTTLLRWAPDPRPDLWLAVAAPAGTSQLSWHT